MSGRRRERRPPPPNPCTTHQPRTRRGEGPTITAGNTQPGEYDARPDPPVPADGRCFVCGKQRKPERSRKYGGLVAENDPFCSNTCARAYHGQPDLDQQGRERRLAGARTSKAHGGFKHGTRDGYWLCACDECRAAVGREASVA